MMDLQAIIYVLGLISAALAFGSFTNVLIYRIPRRESIITPGSYCPHCKHPLSWRENIPLLSFILLKGKCKFCERCISWQYPFVEMIVALVSSTFIFKYFSMKPQVLSLSDLLQNLISGHAHPLLIEILAIIKFLFLLSFLAITVSLAFIDNQTKELPHQLTYGGILLAIPFSLLYGDCFKCLMSVGAMFFIFDSLTHFANKIYFKKQGLQIASAALTFRLKFFENKITIIYLFWIPLSLYLFFNSQYEILRWLFMLMGCSYIINDIFLDFLINPGGDRSRPIPINALDMKTVMGGGDAAMAAFAASIFYLKTALFIVLASFYMALSFVIIKILFINSTKIYIKLITSCHSRVSGNPWIPGQDWDDITLRNRFIPLGVALAIAIIVAMILIPIPQINPS